MEPITIYTVTSFKIFSFFLFFFILIFLLYISLLWALTQEGGGTCPMGGLPLNSPTAVDYWLWVPIVQGPLNATMDAHGKPYKLVDLGLELNLKLLNW
jgi:hypothetical protein